jgi:membrane fusion protein, multidrug efflux system
MKEDPISKVEQAKPAAPTELKPGGTGTRSKAWWWILALILLGLIGGYIYYNRNAAGTSTTGASPVAGKKGGAGGRQGEMQVVAVKSSKGNIGVYFTALGTVTPVYTVSVKSRVDGQLMHVYYTEGQMVKEGDPLVDLDPRPYQAQLTQYEGNLLKDQAALENARIDVTRYQTLIAKKAVTEQILATQKTTVTQDEGTVKNDQGLIESVKLNIAYCHITAPISGRLGLRLVDPGNYVQAASTTPLAVITQVQPISVIFTLAEDQIPTVLQKTHSGQRLSVEAFDRAMQIKLGTGYLTTLDNQIDQSTGTLKLRAILDNKQGMLVANQFVNTKLLVETKKGVTLLTSAAIQRNSQNTYVYVVKPDKTVTIRKVTLGTTDGIETEVTSGLEPGEIVVMSGVDTLQEGSKVNAHITGEKAPGSK